MTKEQHARFVEIQRRNEPPQECLFIHTVKQRPALPMCGQPAEEVRDLGITGLVMLRSPWWDSVPPPGNYRGKTTAILYTYDADETAGEIPWR